ncbi:MAG: hypothetical protein H5U37_04495, partial [Caldisericia bacterium]|nr:hypothetical protein [Caldisericia bacterium]
NIYALLTGYYPQENGKISYKYLINRMCFWMATGSGTTTTLFRRAHTLHKYLLSSPLVSFSHIEHGI